MRFVGRILLLVGALSCWGSIVTFGGEPSAQPLLDRQALPAALRGVALQPAEVLTAQQAAKVRGSWAIRMNLPYFATQIEGQGPFSLEVWTLSKGIVRDQPVYIRLMVP